MNRMDFRVIIVGAGPTGMFMAKALSTANIDFVVLERGPRQSFQRGNQLILWPHTARQLRQIGLFDELRKRSYCFRDKVDLMKEGRVIGQSSMWKILEEEHGYPFLAVSRGDLIETLFDSIPDNLRIRTDAKITDIQQSDGGVVVSLADGTKEHGSILVGADGAHSQVRRYIESISTDKVSKAKYTSPHTSRYYGVYGTGTGAKGIQGKTVYETRDTDRAVQFGAEDFAEDFYFLLYKKMPAPSSDPLKHDEEKLIAMAESFADVFVAPGVKFGDIWSQVDKKTARLVHQSQGFAKTWHAGRAIIIGDAAVATTGVNGLGVSSGVNSAVLLASELHRLSSTSSGQSVTTEAVSAAFANLEMALRKPLSLIHRSDAWCVGFVTWASWRDWLVDRFLKRRMPHDGMMHKSMHEVIQNGQILSYLPFEDLPSKIPYTQQPKFDEPEGKCKVPERLVQQY